MPDFRLENDARAEGAQPVAGIDEAGRGPWAGPVVAAAVVLDRARLPDDLRLGLDDSKKLSASRRAALYERLHGCAHIGVGAAQVEEIDRLNILAATLLAMQRAVAALPVRPGLALVDGNRMPQLFCPARCVIGGDGLSLSIAAASIVAKVTRDGIMRELAILHPGYGWEKNAGYGTRQHRDALARLGLTPHHRMSFKPIKMLGEGVARTPTSGSVGSL
jgi:ribonuclease HII